MSHPHEQDLALFARGDAPWWKTLFLRRHLERCEACLTLVEQFEALPAWLAPAKELPPDLHWNRLAEEMRANIRLGLEAGACVAPPPRPQQRLGWKPAIAFASICLLLLSGWLIYFPKFRFRPAPPPPNVVLGGSSTGIEVRQDGRGLALMHEHAESVTVLAAAEGAIAARYVDAETGNVTISHVYAE